MQAVSGAGRIGVQSEPFLCGSGRGGARMCGPSGSGCRGWRVPPGPGTCYRALTPAEELEGRWGLRTLDPFHPLRFA